MAIQAQCDQCGFRYAAPDSLAGKKVRCKRCGAVFALPATDAPATGTPAAGTPAVGAPAAETAEDADWTSSLKNLEESAHAISSAGTAAGQGLTGGAEESVDAILSGALSAEGLSAAEVIRETRPFDFPYSREVDKFLPPGLALLSGLILILQTWGTDDLEALGRPWVPVMRVAMMLGLYALLVWPLTYLGLRQGVQAQRAHMPWSPKWKSFAAFIFPFVLGYTLWLVGRNIPSLLLGCIAGLLVALAAVWLLFRVRLDRGLQPLVYPAITFLIAIGLAAAFITGVNHTVYAIAMGSRTAHEYASSPILPGLRWDPTQPPPVEEPLIGEPSGPRIVSPEPAPQPPPADEPPAEPPAVVQDTPPAPEPPAPPAPDAPPAPPAPDDDATAAGPPDLFDATPETPAPPPVEPPQTIAPPAPDTPRVPPPSDDDRGIRPSEFVREVKQTGVEGGFSRVLYSPAGGDHILVVRRSDQEDQLECWNTTTWTMTGRHRARPDPAAAGREPYALSPDGTVLAMIVSWPTLAVQVWSLRENRVVQLLELDRQLGQPGLVGFVSPSQIAVHWQREHAHGLQVWDLRAQRSSRLELTGVDTLENNFALSPDGRTCAIAGRSSQGPAVALFAITAQRVMRLLPIRLLDAQWGVKPSGLAFAPDGSALTALFEKDGNALICTWRLPNGRDVPPVLLPAGSLVGTSAEAPGRQLSWIPDTEVVLLHGADLVEIGAGRLIGQTGFRHVQSQHVTPTGSIHLVYTDESARTQIVEITLDPSKLPAPRD